MSLYFFEGCLCSEWASLTGFLIEITIADEPIDQASSLRCDFEKGSAIPKIHRRDQPIIDNSFALS